LCEKRIEPARPLNKIFKYIEIITALSDPVAGIFFDTITIVDSSAGNIYGRINERSYT
jgi:hypothetical protein